MVAIECLVETVGGKASGKWVFVCVRWFAKHWTPGAFYRHHHLVIDYLHDASSQMGKLRTELQERTNGQAGSKPWSQDSPEALWGGSPYTWDSAAQGCLSSHLPGFHSFKFFFTWIVKLPSWIYIHGVCFQAQFQFLHFPATFTSHSKKIWHYKQHWFLSCKWPMDWMCPVSLCLRCSGFSVIFIISK